MYDRRSFIPNEATTTVILEATGIDLDTLTFWSSDQTGGWCMADIYMFPFDDRVAVITGEVFAVYDNMAQWNGCDDEGNEVTEADYDTQVQAHFDGDSYPDSNSCPALFMMAQFWTADKYQRVVSELQAKVDTAKRASDELEAIKAGWSTKV